MISVLSVVFVILVLLFTFQSVGLPVLLILIIQGSILFNFSFPGLTQSPIFFLSYLIVTSIQMGANIDYAIVIGSRFLTVKKPKTLRMLGSYIISWSIRLTTGRAICDPTSGMRMFNRAMVEEFAQNLNYGPEPDTISYLIKNGATVKEVQVEMGERLAGQSYLTFWRSVQYMVKMSISILLIQWFRKRDTETPYPERSL